MDELTDAELLALSDAPSFDLFYRRHARRIAGWLMRATGDVEVAADLTADTFAAALASRERYDPAGGGAPSTWLFAIASHKVNDWRRRGYAEDRARRRLGIERPALGELDVRDGSRGIAIRESPGQEIPRHRRQSRLTR